jgi:hypothetical protein
VLGGEVLDWTRGEVVVVVVVGRVTVAAVRVDTNVVDPFFQVAFIFVFIGDGFVLREAVCLRWQSVGLV